MEQRKLMSPELADKVMQALLGEGGTGAGVRR